MPKTSHIYKALSKAYDQAKMFDADIDDMKWVVFSDHHRGVRDGADDFLACESTYIKALQYYYQKGYSLLLLGDVEEFWENAFKRVINSYRKYWT